MDQDPNDINATAPGDVRAIEGAFKTLWDKARRAGEVIARLKEDKHHLQKRTQELEKEVAQLREALSAKEQLIKKSGAAQAEQEVRQGKVFSNGEREVLASKVKELLARIDAYL